MRRYVALFVVVTLIGVVIWRCRDSSTTSTPVVADARATVTSVLRRPRPPIDVKGISRAAITGTVTGDRPLAGVRVCVRGEAAELPDELFREPACASTDARGVYAIEGLFPAAYYATAVLRGFEPLTWGEPREAQRIRVRANEHRTGIDFALRRGGVELTGLVSDLTGGPIGGAKVQAIGSGVTETDDKGAFTLWVKPGTIDVQASADGYADASEDVWVPKEMPVRALLVLTPEASLAGDSAPAFDTCFLA